MWTVNSEGRQAYLPGWLASQSDMLADDWMEYKEPDEGISLNSISHPIAKKTTKTYNYAWKPVTPKEISKKPHWTQTPEGKKIMAKRRNRGSKK